MPPIKRKILKMIAKRRNRMAVSKPVLPSKDSWYSIQVPVQKDQKNG